MATPAKTDAKKTDGETRLMSVDEAMRTIADTGNGYWAILCTNSLCINCAMQSVETTVLTYLTSCAEGTFHLNAGETAFLVSVVYMGMVAGALFLNPLLTSSGVGRSSSLRRLA